MDDFGALQILWFTLIAVLWVGYFFLEGFDFGAGMLLRVVGRERTERRAVIHTIGPVWDGNEVWLIVAGGATFAAFPDWYATLFSGFYIPLFLVVAGLLLRPAALEFWGKDDRPAWRNACEWGLIVGSALPAFLWGLVFANMVHGVPIDGQKEFTGSLADVFGPYALLGGLTALLLCASHGANYLTLKTEGAVLERSRRAALVLTPACTLSVSGFLAWTLLAASDAGRMGPTALVLGVAAALVACAVPFVARRHAGWAFASGGLMIGLVFATLFADLYPNVMVSSTSSTFDLTLGNASASSYALTVITVVACVMLPAVLVSQGWTYWVFRRRIDQSALKPKAPVVELPTRRDDLDDRLGASVG